MEIDISQSKAENEMVYRHFGTSAEVSRHFGTGAEVSYGCFGTRQSEYLHRRPVTLHII